MSVLSTLNITTSQLQKINPDLYEAYLDIQEVKKSIEEGLSDTNIMKVYNSSIREIETYLLSDEFTAEAKAKGITLRSVEESKQITAIEAPEDVDMSVLEALYGDDIKVVEEEAKEEPAKPSEEPAEEPVEEPKEDDPLAGLYGDEPQIEETPAPTAETPEEEEEILAAEYGYKYSVDHKKNIDTLIVNIEKLIAYGGNDYSIGYYESDDSFNYQFNLPLCEGRIIVAHDLSQTQFEGAVAFDKIIPPYGVGLKQDFNIYLVSELKEELVSMNEILMSAFKTDSIEQRQVKGGVTPLGSADFGDDILDEYNYEQVNSAFDAWSDSVRRGRLSFLEMQKDIEENWSEIFGRPKLQKAAWISPAGYKKVLEDGKELTEAYYLGDYKYQFKATQNGFSALQKVYMPLNYIFKKGGKFVQTNNQVFYTPSGRKQELLYDVGKNFKKFGISTKDFDRDSGKIAKSEFNSLTSCRIAFYADYEPFERVETDESKAEFYSFSSAKQKRIMQRKEYFDARYEYKFNPPLTHSYDRTSGAAVVISEDGRAIAVNALSLNHFIKYYGIDIQFKSSENYLCVFDDDEMVGFMPIVHSGNSIGGFYKVLQIDDVSPKLRGQYAQVYDYMIPITDLYSEEFFGISKDEELPSPTPIVSPQEVEEIKKEGEEPVEEPAAAPKAEPIDDDPLAALYGDEPVEEPAKEEDEMDEETREAVEDIVLGVQTMQGLMEEFKDDEEAMEEFNTELIGLKSVYEMLTGKKYEDEK